MATQDFEVQQILKAYRKGLISDEVFEQQMKDVTASNSGLDVANVLTHRGDGSKVSSHMLHKTPQSETAVFTIPANFHADRENTHKGDQLIYIIDGNVTARVSVEQASIFGWAKYVGLNGHCIGMRSYGASAPLKDLQREFGFSAERVAEAAREQLKRARA